VETLEKIKHEDCLNGCRLWVLVVQKRAFSRSQGQRRHFGLRSM